ncbi:hypothetical protein [Streptomyces sp. NPDC048442]|uniref:hypothetical protein n=1 Tax=Streptomyces sp. NPDC048442 TaxID=3154823 RepID=UPI00342BA3BB
MNATNREADVWGTAVDAAELSARGEDPEAPEEVLADEAHPGEALQVEALPGEALPDEALPGEGEDSGGVILDPTRPAPEGPAPVPVPIDDPASREDDGGMPFDILPPPLG